MSDFEDRLRAELVDAAEPLGPTPGLRADVDRRVRHHRRVRRAQVMVGVVGVLLVVIGVGVFLESDEHGNEPQTFADVIDAHRLVPPNDPSQLPGRCDAEGLVDGASDADRMEELVTGTAPAADSIEERYVGLDEHVALAQAGEDGRLARVICRDGVAVGQSLGFVDGRLDLHVIGGVVVAVWVEETVTTPLD